MARVKKKKAPAGYRWKTVTKLNAIGRPYTTKVLVPLDPMEAKFKEAELESYKAIGPYPGQAVDPSVKRTPVQTRPARTRASAGIDSSSVKTPTNLLGQVLDPVRNIPKKAEEHRLAGIKAIEEATNPGSAALGGLQWLASPISGTMEALWDKPVSDNLQNAGMSEKAADNVALYSGTLLPFVGQVKNVANIPKAINLAVKNTSKTKGGQQAVNDLRDGVNSALTNTKVEDVLSTNLSIEAAKKAASKRPLVGPKPVGYDQKQVLRDYGVDKFEDIPPIARSLSEGRAYVPGSRAMADDTAGLQAERSYERAIDEAVSGPSDPKSIRRIQREIDEDAAFRESAAARDYQRGLDEQANLAKVAQAKPPTNLADDVPKVSASSKVSPTATQATAISSPFRARRRLPQAAAIGTAAALVPSSLGDGETKSVGRVGGSGYQQWDKGVQDSIQPDATMGGGPQDRAEAYAAQVGGQPRTNNIGGQPATEEQMSWAEKYYGAKFARDPAARYKKNKEFKQSLWKKMAILNAIAALTGNTSQAEQYATYALGMHEDAMQFDDDMRMHKMHKAVYFRPDGTFDPPKNSEAAYNRAIQIGASPDEAKEVYGFTPTKKSKDQYHRVDPNDPTKWEHKRFDVGDDIPEDWIKGKAGSSSPVTTYAQSNVGKMISEMDAIRENIRQAEAAGNKELVAQEEAKLQFYANQRDKGNQSTNFNRVWNTYKGLYPDGLGGISSEAPNFWDWVKDTGPKGGARFAEGFEADVSVESGSDADIEARVRAAHPKATEQDIRDTVEAIKKKLGRS